MAICGRPSWTSDFNVSHKSWDPVRVACTPASSEPAYVQLDSMFWPDMHTQSQGVEDEMIAHTLGTSLWQSISNENQARVRAEAPAEWTLKAAITNHELPGRDSLKLPSPDGRHLAPFGQARTWPADRARTHGRSSGNQPNFQQSRSFQDQRSKKRNLLPKRRTVVLIASHLNELQQEDPNTILIVRKINRLGFGSADILKDYFQTFGPVVKVRLSSPHQKQNEGSIRLRPSGIGFVLFQSAEDASQALALGDVHVIAGVEVIVRGFERRRDNELGEDDENCIEMHDVKHPSADAAEEEEEEDKGWCATATV